MCVLWEGWIKKIERKKESLKVERAFKKKVIDFPPFLVQVPASRGKRC